MTIKAKGRPGAQPDAGNLGKPGAQFVIIGRAVRAIPQRSRRVEAEVDTAGWGHGTQQRNGAEELDRVLPQGPQPIRTRGDRGIIIEHRSHRGLAGCRRRARGVLDEVPDAREERVV
jgi:hypothetical protein